MRRLVILAAVSLIALGAGEARAKRLTGKVQIDGSSTVFPITEAVAEEYRGVESKVRVTVGISGTGGGFKQFCVGETDINDASRPIKEKEQSKAAAAGVEYIELPVAYDGISVVIHPDNTWVDHFTPAELKALWEPGSAVKTWADIRKSWPAEKIKLYGPGTDSGTFDYFTEVINGKAQACRSDFTASEDDNVLVQGVEGDRNALGFFGYAYYVENQDKLKVVPIDSGHGPVPPSMTSINDGSYAPLSRPIFIYVSKTAAARPEVESFVKFYLESAPDLVPEVGYVPLPASLYQVARERFEKRVTGTVFGADHDRAKSLEGRYRLAVGD